jgi:hypothetical protein
VNYGGTTFPAFTVGTPIEILDQITPAHNEQVTVTSIDTTSNQCNIGTTTPVYQHTQFSLGSATAGLQEAINANLNTSVPVTVHLTSDWFRQGGTLSMVTTSIVGNTSIGIVDDTKTPTAWYDWVSPNYVEVAIGGGAGNPCTTVANGIQYNNAGAFGCSTPLTFNPASGLLNSTLYGAGVGSQITAASTIAPTHAIQHVTGGTPINTITVPAGMSAGGWITLIPDSAFTWTAAGNISVLGQGTIGAPITFTFDGTKWNPSYLATLPTTTSGNGSYAPILNAPASYVLVPPGSIFYESLTGDGPSPDLVSTSITTAGTWTDVNVYELEEDGETFAVPNGGINPGAVIQLVVSQPTGGGGPYAQGVGASNSPLSNSGSPAQALVNLVPGGCPTIGTNIGATAPSKLLITLEYNINVPTVSEDEPAWYITQCTTANPSSGGAITALTGDATTSGAGSTAATVVGVNGGTPFTAQASGAECNTTGTGQLAPCTNIAVTGSGTFGSQLQVGPLSTGVVTNTQQLWQDTGENEATVPMGFGAGHAGTLNVVQTQTIGAPSVTVYATGSGSNTYSYVCAGTDYDGNLINGTTTTVTNVPTVFGGSSPYVTVACPWWAGVYSFQIYRTVGGSTQGLLASIVGNGAGFNDTNGAAGGGTPPASNNSNPSVVVHGSGTPSMQLGPTNISTGTGAPTSTCGTAPIGSGSLWLRTDGSTSTSLYSCAGTTWTAVTVP